MENVAELNKKEDVLYGPQWYDVDKQVISELKTLKPYKPVLAAIHAWFWIFVLVKSFLYFYPQSIYFYPLVILFIAGRAGAFLQLAHEAAHGLVSHGKFNNWFGNWLASYPLGFDLKGYGEPHLYHHACTNQICDPLSDSEKYRVCDIRNPKLLLFFIKDLLGITALMVKFRYDQFLGNQYREQVDEYLKTQEDQQVMTQFRSSPTGQNLKRHASIILVQLIILGALFNFNLYHYIFLWFVPLATVHMFLMRVRGIGEHGLGIQLGVPSLERNTRGTFFTRSFGTPVKKYSPGFLVWIERLLIGSLNVYYHHEHHLYPKVPYYNLPKIHKYVYEKVNQNNPNIYVRGYFDCLFFNLRKQPPVPSPFPNFP